MAGDGERFDGRVIRSPSPNGPITPLPNPLICLASSVSTLRTTLNLRRRVSPRFASQFHHLNNGARGSVGIDKGSHPP